MHRGMQKISLQGYWMVRFSRGP